MELIFLGRDSMLKKDGMDTSAYWLEEGPNGKVLNIIDIGARVTSKVLKLLNRFKFSDVNIIITHLHGDHVGGLNSVIFEAFYKYGIIPNIYVGRVNISTERTLSTSMLHDIVKYNRLMGVDDGLYKLYDSKNIYTLNGTETRIHFLLNDHVSQLNSFGFTITNEKGVKIYYSGDVNNTQELTKKLQEGYLCYHEVSVNVSNAHTYYENIASIESKYKPNIRLMHLDDLYVNPEDADVFWKQLTGCETVKVEK